MEETRRDIDSDKPELSDVAESNPKPVEKVWDRLHKMLEGPQSVLLLTVITILITLPVFIVVYRNMPIIELPIGDGFRIGHILIFSVIFIISYLLIRQYRMIVYGLVLVGLVTITITSFMGTYSMRNVYHDYAAMLYGLQEGAIQLSFKNEKEPFSNEEKMKMAVNYRNKEVRNYALNISVKNFDEESSLGPNRKVIQSFSIFKEIREKWRYVSDPMDEDYFATASETIGQLAADDKFKGDCDDYSILMAACIKAIGGEVRLVRTTITMEDGEEIGHLYPEVKIGDEKDLENVTYLIKEVLFKRETRDKHVYFHTDKHGYVWLNFDYNDRYPGGKYQSLVRNSELKL
jgi:hypothetical protein